MKRIIAGLAATIAALAAVPAAAQTPSRCDRLSAADKVLALNAIQNLMGRYDHLGTLRGEGTLAELFALNTEGVSWKTPNGPVGIEGMRARFARPDEVPTPGVLHMHAVLSPVIEIAGDGRTAKGVWDSFGPNIVDPSKEGGWLWGKYGVDFVKEGNAWKIWHLQFYPVFNTLYHKSITETAREMAAGGREEGGPGRDPSAGAPPPGAAGAPPAGPRRGPPGSDLPGYTVVKVWRYDGKSTPQGPFIPEPYCTFDPKTAY